MKRVIVDWVDSSSHPGWKSKGAAYSVSICHTAGFLVHKGKREVHIAQSWSECGSVGDVIAIPRSCVKKMEVW